MEEQDEVTVGSAPAFFRCPRKYHFTLMERKAEAEAMQSGRVESIEPRPVPLSFHFTKDLHRAAASALEKEALEAGWDVEDTEVPWGRPRRLFTPLGGPTEEELTIAFCNNSPTRGKGKLLLRPVLTHEDIQAASHIVALLKAPHEKGWTAVLVGSSQLNEKWPSACIASLFSTPSMVPKSASPVLRKKKEWELAYLRFAMWLCGQKIALRRVIMLHLERETVTFTPTDVSDE
eukprot:Sspe_Gene.42707::Locus_20765_Transcript_2_2_Confidence_0.750_Length_2272::g.42707::m.42707